MKKYRSFYRIILLLAVLLLVSGGKAQAASAKKLFSIVVNDGFTSQTVPVYQYTESDGSVYVAAKKSLRVLPVYAGAQTAQLSLKGRTSLYKNNYQSVSYKKKVALSDTASVALKLKKKDGSVLKAVLKLIRPAMPRISALSASPGRKTGFTPGNYNRMSLKISVRSGVDVATSYVVKNSSGKVVYQRELYTKKSVNYTSYWSGKSSEGNAAGLPANAYVPAGNYKVTASVKYTVGKRTKTIKKTISIKINDAQGGDGDSAGQSSAGNGGFQARYWGWKVILTGDDTADYLAELICQQELTAGMGEAARAKALYTWVGNHMTHAYSAPVTSGAAYVNVTSRAAQKAIADYAAQADKMITQNRAAEKTTDYYFTDGGDKRKQWIREGLIYRNGDCLIMAMVYSTLCRHAGIEADILENSLPGGGNGHHFWNVVRINGSYYMTDADMVTYSSGISSYDYFLRGRNYFYTMNRYSSVRTTGGYAIAARVSKNDCPER